MRFVAEHKGGTQGPMVITVEPDMAACLMASLQNSKVTPIQIGNTIMCGMNCDTVSKIARP